MHLTCHKSLAINTLQRSCQICQIFSEKQKNKEKGLKEQLSSFRPSLY